MNAIQILNGIALKTDRAKYPNMPDHCRPKPKYSDRTTNGLTKCVVDWLRFNGYQAERIAVTGRQIDNREVVSDVIGRQRIIGTTKWIKGSMQTGTADISATIKGRSVKIEVKCAATRDSIQSPAQKQYQKEVEQAGGVYLIVRDFQGFYQWYIYFIHE